MLIPMEVFNKIGEMDESFFVYDEDLDWCLRGRDVGYKVIVLRDAVAYHNSPGTKLIRPSRIYYGTRNRLILARKHGYLTKLNGI